MYDVAREVIAKPWPADVVERFKSDQEPIILIVDRDWSEFDPREHPYAIVWVSGFSAEPQTVRPLLQQLALRVRRGDDLIAYLHGIAKHEERNAVIKGADRGAGMLARVASYVEIKPTVFGVAIDLKAILRDIAERRR